MGGYLRISFWGELPDENCPGPATQKECLTARQELSRQRAGLASPDNSDTHDSNAGRGPASTRLQGYASARQGRRSYKVHSGDIGGGPEPAELQATQWRLRWRTGDVARRRRWRTGSRRTSREPAAGVMDRRRSGQRSDSESRSLRTAGLGQPAGPRHSPAPTGVRRGTSDGHGWIGSKAVEITGSRVGRAVIQD